MSFQQYMPFAWPFYYTYGMTLGFSNVLFSTSNIFFSVPLCTFSDSIIINTRCLWNVHTVYRKHAAAKLASYRMQRTCSQCRYCVGATFPQRPYSTNDAFTARNKLSQRGNGTHSLFSLQSWPFSLFWFVVFEQLNLAKTVRSNSS